MARTYKAGVLITGDSKGAVQAINLTEKEVDNLNKTTAKSKTVHADASKSITAGFTSMATKAAAWSAAAITAGAAVTTSLVKSGLASADALAKTADKLGVATESLASLRYAAGLTGVESGKLDNAIGKLAVRVTEAASGTGMAAESFKALGLSAKSLMQLPLDKQMGVIADRINNVENASQKAKIAYDVFGRSGIDLINTLALGSEGLAKLTEEADVLGITLSRVDAAKIEAANDAMSRIGTGVDGLGQQLAVKFAPALQGIADKLFEITKEAGGVGSIADKVFTFMIKGAGKVGDGVRGLQIVFKTLQLGVQSFALAFVKSWDMIFEAVSAVANMIPGVDIQYEGSTFDKFVDDLRDSTFATMNEIHDLLEEPLPSAEIEHFINNVQRASTTATIAIDNQRHSTEQLQEVVVSATRIEKDLTVSLHETAAATDTVTAAADRMSSTWASSRDLLSDFFFEFAADGKNAFDTLVEGFKAMIAKMIAEAAANQIILGIGTVAGGLGFSSVANAATSAVGGGGLASSAYGLFTQGSSLFGNQGLQFAVPGDGGAALGAQFSWANAGMGLAGGLAGGFAANQVFGRTSGIGSTLGGLAGTLIPGIGPLLGAGIGSFLGGGLESILGGKNNGDNKGRADIDLSTGAFNTYGVGKSFNQANVDEAGRVSQQLKALSDALGGSDAALKIAVGNKSGYSLNGEKFGKDVDAFFSAATKSIIEGAKQLDPVIKSLALAYQGTAEETAVYAQSLGSVYEAIKVNAVDRAAADIEAAAKASNSLYDAYFDQVDIITDLVRTFDGSATAAANLNTSLLAGKEAAYALAAGIASIGDQVSKTLLDSADQIRNSVLTQEEREAALRYKGKFLETILPAVTNPDDILTIANELEKIITTLYNAYENPTTADAELAASALERIEATTRVQLEKSLENVRQAEEATNQRTAALFDEAARQNQEAARQQLESANIQRENMANFGYYVERLTRSNTQGNARPILAGGEVA